MSIPGTTHRIRGSLFLIRSKCLVNGGVKRASKRLSSALYNPGCTLLASFTLAVTIAFDTFLPKGFIPNHK